MQRKAMTSTSPTSRHTSDPSKSLLRHHTNSSICGDCPSPSHQSKYPSNSPLVRLVPLPLRWLSSQMTQTETLTVSRYPVRRSYLLSVFPPLCRFHLLSYEYVGAVRET